MKKEIEKMTFKEFWEEAKKETKDSENIENLKREALEILRRDGFSEEQINEMKMKEFWSLFLNSFSAEFKENMTMISRGLEEKPWAAPIVASHMEKLRRMLEEWVNELEERLHKREKGEEG